MSDTEGKAKDEVAKVKATADASAPQSDGKKEKNSALNDYMGLAVGAIIAVFAVIGGMGSLGFVLGFLALAAGVMSDGKKGLMGDLFGRSESSYIASPAIGNVAAASATKTSEAATKIDNTVTLEADPKYTIITVSKDGKKLEKEGAESLQIVVDSKGQVQEYHVFDKEGKPELGKNGKPLRLSGDEKTVFTVTNGTINLGSDESKKQLENLRDKFGDARPTWWNKAKSWLRGEEKPAAATAKPASAAPTPAKAPPPVAKPELNAVPSQMPINMDVNEYRKSLENLTPYPNKQSMNSSELGGLSSQSFKSAGLIAKEITV